MLKYPPFSYSMMMLDFLFSHSTVSSCCWFIFQARLLLENNSLARFNFPFKYYPRDSNKWKLKWLVNLRKEFILFILRWSFNLRLLYSTTNLCRCYILHARFNDDASGQLRRFSGHYLDVNTKVINGLHLIKIAFQHITWSNLDQTTQVEIRNLWL